LGTIEKEISISGLKTSSQETKSNSVLETNEETKEEAYKDVQEDVTVSESQEIVVDTKIPEALPTKVIQTNNLPESYDTVYNSVKIKNETDFNLSESDLTPDLEFVDKSDIIIFHTHTCEAYTQTEENTYIPSRKL